jgi:hypothetical protein
MMNQHNRTRKLGAKGDTRTPFACLGWEDARLGRPFRYDVSGSMELASAYENARLRVLTLRTLGLPVPAWNAAHTVPPKVRGAILRVAKANADAPLSGGLATTPTGPRRWLPAEAGA